MLQTIVRTALMLLIAACSQMVTSEKHQKSLLGGIERLCGETYPSLIPNGVPKIIMALYQADVLDEEVIKQWGTHVSKKVSKPILLESRSSGLTFSRTVRRQGDVQKGSPRLRARPQMARRSRGRVLRGRVSCSSLQTFILSRICKPRTRLSLSM